LSIKEILVRFECPNTNEDCFGIVRRVRITTEFFSDKITNQELEVFCPDCKQVHFIAISWRSNDGRSTRSTE
jgi:Zn finger protein HypA/HybF involved in hydrogenase expression